MGLPMFGVFVLAADRRLYYAQCLVIYCLQEAGWWQRVARHPLWNPLWTLLPVVFFAVVAWCLVKESGKVKMSEGHRRTQQ